MDIERINALLDWLSGADDISINDVADAKLFLQIPAQAAGTPSREVATLEWESKHAVLQMTLTEKSLATAEISEDGQSLDVAAIDAEGDIRRVLIKVFERIPVPVPASDAAPQS